MMDDMLEKKRKKLPPEAEDDGPPTGPDGKPLKPRPFKKGGKVMKKMNDGGQIGPKFATDETVKAEVNQRFDEEPYKSRVANLKKETADAKAKDAKALAPFKMAKGGSASSRADGCAQRGKTRGKMM
jgi:hypothetical protein